MAEVRLTVAQQAVVENRGGALLVSAAAGSGKTKVLVDRLLSMILDVQNPHSIDDFLIITYTKAAAAELRGKILAALQEQLAKMPGNRHLQRQLTRIYLAQISTVHAFCANILREHAYRLDIPADFRVAEELECRTLRQRAMEQCIREAYAGQNTDFLAFADTLGAGRDDRGIAELTETVYDKAQSHRDPDTWLRGCAEKLEMDKTTDFAKTIWGEILFADLQQFLDDEIEAMQRAIALIAADEALEKAYYPTFSEILRQLCELRACPDWDSVVRYGMPDFGRLKAVRKCEQPEVKEMVQFIRKDCADQLKRRLRCFSTNSEETAEEVTAIAPAIRGVLRLAREFGVRYAREKRRRHILDFSDLEHEAIRLFCGSSGNRATEAAREISLRYQEILVDEYQDSNEVQDAIFRAISREEQNLFMVGDVKQSIYRFRLADPGIFLEKYKTFAPYTKAKPGQPRKILLSENFRSRGEVLDAVNRVFERAMSERVGELAYGEAEALRQGLEFPATSDLPVELHCIQEDFESEGEGNSPQKADVEAAFLANRIGTLLADGTQITEKGTQRPIRPGDIAILLRSPKSAAGSYMAALQSAGIPCCCDTGEDILQTTELQVLTSLFEVIANPHQDIPLLAVLASPLFEFTASELAMIRGEDRTCDFYDALCSTSLPKAVKFRELLDHFRSTAETDGLTAVYNCMERETDLTAIFGAMRNGPVRIGNVQYFRNLVVSHAQSGGTLTTFIRTIRDLRETGLVVQNHSAADAVMLLSIHKSKGLEYPVVCLAGLSKAFNLEDLTKQVLIHPEYGVASNVIDLKLKVRYPSVAKQALSRKLRQEAISEELRILYVAMTRAKDRLIMTFCERHLVSRLKRLTWMRNSMGAEALASRASCHGDWILAEALGRTEAGALHNLLADRPWDTAVSEIPWNICWHSGSAVMQMPVRPGLAMEPMKQAALPDALELERELDYTYPYLMVGQVPSKLTATQLKGRKLDEEVSECAIQPSKRWRNRRPAFLGRRMSATERGTAIHLAMQFIRYEACGDLNGIQVELERLQTEEFLTAEQAAAVDPKKILKFFQSALGQRVLHAPQRKREFKFSVFLDAEAYTEEAAGEKILLQGVTDCCLMESDGIVILDFKTDRLTPGGESERAEYYRGQLEGYAAALSRIFAQPVKEKILYFFTTDTAVTL